MICHEEQRLCRDSTHQHARNDPDSKFSILTKRHLCIYSGLNIKNLVKQINEMMTVMKKLLAKFIAT